MLFLLKFNKAYLILEIDDLVRNKYVRVCINESYSGGKHSIGWAYLTYINLYWLRCYIICTNVRLN